MFEVNNASEAASELTQKKLQTTSVEHRNMLVGDVNLENLITEQGNDVQKVLDVFHTAIEPQTVPLDDPRFLAFIPNAPTQAVKAFDTLMSAYALNGISWIEGAGTIAAENQVLDFLAQEAGMPETAGGCFVSGGSAGNLASLATARDWKAPTAQGRQMGIILGAHAHSSLKSTAKLLGLTVVAGDDEGGKLTKTAVKNALAVAWEQNICVTAIAVTAGTTNSGQIDELEGISQLAQTNNLWFHVDAAYGGGGLLAPSVKPLFKGIENADSLVLDPHKWLFAQMDCGAVLYKDAQLAKDTHRQNGEYLQAIHDDGGWNPSDYAYHLSRRARGMPLWYSLSVHGVDAYRQAVTRGVELAKQAADYIQTCDNLTLVMDPPLSIVLFEREDWDRQNWETWSKELRGDGVAFVLPTVWQNKTVGRLALMHPNTEFDTIKQTIDRANSQPT